ncbi:MAG: hypothetical protein LBC88_03310, partial [Spirochaetaceae bacterium]|nr:hypothetical protein [Spirochaetaceae bacterium]
MYKGTWDDQTGSKTEKTTDDKTVSVYYGGGSGGSPITLTSPDKAEIKGGKLTVSIATAPAADKLTAVSALVTDLNEDYTNVNASPNTAKLASLTLVIDSSNQ